MDELRELIALLRDNGPNSMERPLRVRLRREMTRSAAPPSEATCPELLMPGPGLPRRTIVSALSPRTRAPGRNRRARDQDLHIIPSPIVGTTSFPFADCGCL
jgi:hypothetical protein